MPDDSKPSPEWQHDQKINLSNMKELMIVLKDRVEETIVAKKKELAQLIMARDSLRK
jgi:AAA15 family ATPase/GTPase